MFVTTKKQNLKLFSTGFFGTKLKSWNTFEEVLKSGHKDSVTIRTLAGGGGFCFYDCHIYEVENIISKCALPKELFYFNESAPDEHIVLQGEYYNKIINISGKTYDGTFTHSFHKLKMRDALRISQRTCYGLSAKTLIKDYMSESSWSDFECLLDLYPDHVLELSIYGCNIGDIQGRNAIVWEVRSY